MAGRLAKGPTKAIWVAKWLTNRALDVDRATSLYDEAIGPGAGHEHARLQGGHRQLRGAAARRVQGLVADRPGPSWGRRRRGRVSTRSGPDPWWWSSSTRLSASSWSRWPRRRGARRRPSLRRRRGRGRRVRGRGGRGRRRRRGRGRRRRRVDEVLQRGPGVRAAEDRRQGLARDQLDRSDEQQRQHEHDGRGAGDGPPGEPLRCRCAGQAVGVGADVVVACRRCVAGVSVVAEISRRSVSAAGAADRCHFDRLGLAGALSAPTARPPRSAPTTASGVHRGRRTRRSPRCPRACATRSSSRGPGPRPA